MYPYGHSNPYTNQGYMGPTPPPPVQQVVHHHHHHGDQEDNTEPTAPAHKGRGFKLKSKFSHATQTVVPSVVACILIQAVAAFFQSTADTTFRSVVSNVDDFSDDSDHDLFVINIVFNVFLAAASALTAPMIRNSGYTTIILSGTVLFIFSTMSSSLVSTAKILVLPYGIFGACAYGLLKVGSAVAMLDYLNNRRSLASALTFLGLSVGQVAATMCFIFTDMQDDAVYDDNGQTRWQNNLRIIEVTAVIALMSGAVLKKPSHALGSWPEVFQYKPFYSLTIIYALGQIGFSLFTEIAIGATDELDLDPNFDVHEIFTPFFIYLLAQLGGVLLIIFLIATCCSNSCKKYSCLIGGIAAVLLAAGSFAHKEAYDKLWQLALYTGGAGLMNAFIRVTIPLAMIYYTGRDNYKIAYPFLEFAGAVGGLIAYLIQVEKPDDMSFSDTWYLTGAMFAAFGLGSLLTYCLYPSWSRHKAGNDQHRFDVLEAIENEAFEPDENNFE